MKNEHAFTLVEIMIAVSVVALLAALAMPAFMKARDTVYRNICKNNLRVIDSAKQQWAIENNKGTTDVPTEEELLPFIKGKTKRCFCPLDSSKQFSSSYDINAISTLPVCKSKPDEHKI